MVGGMRRLARPSTRISAILGALALVLAGAPVGERMQLIHPTDEDPLQGACNFMPCSTLHSLLGNLKTHLPFAVEGIAQIQCPSKFSSSATAGTFEAGRKAEYSFCPVRCARFISCIFIILLIPPVYFGGCPALLPVLFSHVH
jgi:hypothetical protein